MPLFISVRWQPPHASNFLEILSQLHDRHVEFVIVVGVAAALHGGSDVTFDLDLVPNWDGRSLAGSGRPVVVDGRAPAFRSHWNAFAMSSRSGAGSATRGTLALNFWTPDGSTEVDWLVAESERFTESRERAVRLATDHRARSW